MKRWWIGVGCIALAIGCGGEAADDMSGEPVADMAVASDQGGQPDQGVERDEDEGAPDPDDGVAPDAGEPDPDAGEPDPDAGEPDPDAGEPDPDAGEPDPDAGGEPEPEPDMAAPDAGPRLDNLFVVMSADDTISEFSLILEGIGLADGLRDDGPWTVFAPTNDAIAEFAMTRPELREVIQNEPEMLLAFMQFHIVQGAFGLDDLVDGAMLPTLDPDASLPVTVDGDGVVQVAGVPVGGPGVPARNGRLFTVDAALVSPVLDPCGGPCPPDQLPLLDRLAGDPRVERFLEFVADSEHAALLRGPDPYTVLAYNDPAWNRVGRDPDFIMEFVGDFAAANRFMAYHIIPGDLSRDELEARGVVRTVEGRNLHFERPVDALLINRTTRFLAANIQARNGRYHVIDDVLRPPTACDGPADCPDNLECVGAAELCLTPRPPADLFEALERDGRFGVLLDLIARAELEPFLRDEGPWTLFAPIDAAFEAMPPDELAALQADPAAIEELLRFHLRAGVVTMGDISQEDPLERAMLNGLLIERSIGPLTLSGAEVLAFDRPAGDDLLHVLGGVMTARHACDAVSVADVDWGIDPQNTIGAGDFISPPCGSPEGVELAYRFLTIDPDEAEQLCVRVVSADFDTVLHVTEGVCRGGEVVACNDDFTPDTQLSAVEIAVQTHTFYHVFVSGATRADHGSVRLAIDSGPCFIRP